MSNDLYPLNYYLTIFSREACIDASGTMKDGMSQELITAVYSVAADKADMTRMCRVLRKYEINTLKQLKEVDQSVILTKWRGIGNKTAEKFFHLQSLPYTEEKELIVRRYIVPELEKQIGALITLAYNAGIEGNDMPSFDYDECLSRALFEIKK